MNAIENALEKYFCDKSKKCCTNGIVSLAQKWEEVVQKGFFVSFVGEIKILLSMVEK